MLSHRDLEESPHSQRSKLVKSWFHLAGCSIARYKRCHLLTMALQDGGFLKWSYPPRSSIEKCRIFLYKASIHLGLHPPSLGNDHVYVPNHSSVSVRPLFFNLAGCTWQRYRGHPASCFIVVGRTQLRHTRYCDLISYIDVLHETI